MSESSYTKPTGANDLPKLAATLAKKYRLSDLKIHATHHNTGNAVYYGDQQGTPIVLKISADSDALAREVACLKAYSGYGGAEIIAYNDPMLIMQQAQPGTTLRDYCPNEEQQAVEILCRSIQALHQAPMAKDRLIPSLGEAFKTLERPLDIPEHILTRAKQLSQTLLNSTSRVVLLHGDLHHDNILFHGDRWLVIDPKGWIGDPAFEPAAYLCNPMPELLQNHHAGDIIHQRIKGCSELLALPEQRISDWLYAKSVLCWAWSLEDRLDPSYWRQLIDILDKNI